MFKQILDVVIPDVTVRDLVSLSGDLRKEWLDYAKVQCIPKTKETPDAQTNIATSEPLKIEFATPLREIEVELFGGKKELALLDEGSEIVLVRKDVWEELGFKVNREQEMMMRTADGSTAPLEGCAEYLEIMVDGLRTWAHVDRGKGWSG
ncbi:hypothetical protein EV368DRAFT_70324 [Lentinula lateritia]|nr:hypothetical protein EV368DRAFT_70324 [Lentinula lateritia]